MTEISKIKSPPTIILFGPFIMGILYMNVTGVAGDYIVSDLGGAFSTSLFGLVFYCLGNILSIPLSDPLAERFGTIKVMVSLLLIYSFFSLLCGLSPTYFIFLTLRLALGIASGPFFVLSGKLLSQFAPKKSQDLCTALLIMFYGVLPVTGASIGGMIAYEYSWRWIFFINIPIAVFMAGYLWTSLKTTDVVKEDRAPFNRLSYFFFSIGFGSFVTAIILAQELDWFCSPIFNWLGGIGVLCIILYLVIDSKSPNSLLELSLFKNPVLALSFFYLALLYFNYYSIVGLIAIWLHLFVSYSPLWIAILLSVEATASVLAFFVGHKFIRSYDMRLTLIAGISCFAISCYITTFFNIYVDIFHLTIARIFSGMGVILFGFPLTHTVAQDCPKELLGRMQSVNQVNRCLFTGLGPALTTIIWERRQAFYFERLGEKLTVYSELTSNFFKRAMHRFNLTELQSLDELNKDLIKQSNSLGLNDTYALMGYILVVLLAGVVLSFVFKKRHMKT